MSAEVVTLRPAKPEREALVWVCRCGCTTHYHRSDDAVECGACGSIATDLTGEWRLKLPETSAEPTELDGANFKVTTLDSPAVFLQRHAKTAAADVVAILILHDDGTFATWSGDMTGPDRSDWLKRQFKKAWGRLTGVKPI